MSTTTNKPAAKKAPGKKKSPVPKNKAGTSKEAAALRRANFVEAYIANGGNAADAAVKAGYSAATARSAGHRLLTDVDVKKQLEERRAGLADRFKLTTERVLEQLGKIVYADVRKAFGPHGSLLPVHEIPDEVAHAITSVKVNALFEGQGEDRKQIGYTQEVKFADKGSAIDKAMKHLGLFKADNQQRNPFEGWTMEQVNNFIALQNQRIDNAGKV